MYIEIIRLTCSYFLPHLNNGFLPIIKIKVVSYLYELVMQLHLVDAVIYHYLHNLIQTTYPKHDTP